MRPGRRLRRARPALRSALAGVACALAATAAVAAAPPEATEPGAATARATAARPEITLSEIGRRAELAADQLRRMADAVTETHDLPALAAAVEAGTSHVATQWSDTALLLESTPQLGQVDGLISTWRALQVDLGRLAQKLGARARAREADTEALATMQKSWTSTRDLAQRTDAPAAVVSRAEATLAAIAATERLVDQRHDRLLVLEDSVSRSLQGCDDAVARLADARQDVLRRMFSDRGPALWQLDRKAFGGADVGGSLRARAAKRIAEGGGNLLLYVGAHREALVATGLLGLVLIAALLRARGRADVLPEQDPLRSSPILRTPIAAAVLLTIVLSRPLRPNPPRELAEILVFVSIPAMIALLRPLLDASTARAMYALAGLVVLDLARAFLRLPRGIEQGVLVIELAAVAWVLRRAARCIAAPDGRRAGWSPGLRASAAAALRGLAIAAALTSAGAFVGYVELADFLGEDALLLAYLTFGLLAFRAAADLLVALLLGTGPLARSHAVRNHRLLLERRIGRVLDLGLFVLWLVTAAQLLEVAEPARALLAAVFATRLRLGGIDFTIGRVIAVPLVVAGAYLASRAVVFALETDLYPRLSLPRGVPYALSSLTRYGLLLIGFFLALAALGLDLTRLTVLVSAFGLGLGFGLQQIINNFVSGLILLFERPLQVGDAIQLGDLLGEVLRIGIRSSTIRTLDGAEVIVPNASLIQERVTNWTLSDQRRRIDVDVGVAYGTEARRVLALLVEVGRQDPRVRSEPEPEALFVGFGDSSLDFQLRVWTEVGTWVRLRSDLCVAIQAALDRAGIEVPFPQRDLHIRTVPAPAGPRSPSDPDAPG